MKKIISSSVLGLLGTTLLLSGCAIGSLGGSSNDEISYIKVDLPKQIEWVQSQNKKMGENGMLQEWVIKGFKSNSTPARIIYQKIVPGVESNVLMEQVLKPFKQSCADVKFTSIPLNTKHGDKIANEMICSKLGKNPVGLVAYTSILSDKSASHLIVGEVRTLPSSKAGQLDIKNEQQRKQAETSAAIAQLMQKMSADIKACDAKNTCQ